MGIFDIFKKKKQLDPMFFDSIEAMENCNECTLYFKYNGYPEVKQKFYKMPISKVKASFDNKIYACINIISSEGVSIEDFLDDNKAVTYSTSGTPIYIQITKESSEWELPYEVMYGFKDGVE